MATKDSTPTRVSARGRTPAGTPTVKQRWTAAKARGDQTFDPGVACIHGHECHRWTNNGICIECKRARDNAYNAAHKEEHRARSRRSAGARPEEIQAYRKVYYAAHADVAKERSREWEIQHPERVRKRSIAWYHKNAPRLREKASKRRAENPEPSRISHRRWKQANKERVLAQYNKRRAIEIGAAVGDRKVYRKYVKWARTVAATPCYWCKKKTKPGARHIDHIIPLARGGGDAVENLCIACPTCNMRKSAKLPEEFCGQSELKLA